jgi:crotonobetainyl-CoA:carnitine CoA-transferase CaiB-like acyl-CoA transferase
MYALEGVRLIDFGQFLAGPYGPMIIADLGAEVIKVEPVTGDGMRNSGKPFFGCQRGKKDIAIDLKTPEGLEIAHKLVATADVVHHNMTKGVAKRLKIDYETCKKIKQDIIYCNSWMYGEEGPLSAFGGLDPLAQAAGGLEYEAGAAHEGNPPLWYRFGMGDTTNAFQTVIGVLLALYHRRKTGQGQYLWSSLLNGGAFCGLEGFLTQEGTKAPPRPKLDKELTGISATYRLYQTIDGWLQLAAVKQNHFEALCQVLGKPTLKDDRRFATEEARTTHRKELEAELEPVFKSRTSKEWNILLDGAGVPNEIPVDTNDGETILFDEENVRLGLVAEYAHPTMGLMRQFGHLIFFSRTPGNIQGPPPLVGENTRDIMRWLGYSEKTIEEYKAKNVIYYPDENYRKRWNW